MNNDKELDQAAEEKYPHLWNSHADLPLYDEDYKDKQEAFKAGAQWQRAQAPKAPEEWAKVKEQALEDLYKEEYGMFSLWSQGFDTACDLIARPLLAKLVHYDKWLSDGVYFTTEEYKRKVSEDTAKIEALKKRVKELHQQCNLLNIENDTQNDQLTAANERAEALAGALEMIEKKWLMCAPGCTCARDTAHFALKAYRAAKGKE